MSTPLMLGPVGLPELIIILVLVLILFGAGRLPDVANALGKSIKSFRDAQRDPEDPDKKQIDVTPEPIEEADESVKTKTKVKSG